MKKKVVLSNLEVMDAVVGLNLLAQERMAILPGFSVAKNRTAIKPHAEEYEKYRKGILTRYGHRDHRNELIMDQKGEVIFVSPDLKETALREIEELGQVEVEIEVQTISFAALKEVNVPPNVVGVLLWMFDEGGDET